MGLEQLRRLYVIKILGLIGLIISFGLIGIYKSLRLKNRIELLEDYYKMILNLKSQINYFKEPLPDMFNKISKTNDSKAINMLKAIVDDFEEKDANLSNLWAKNINTVYDKCPLTDKDKEVISYPGKFVGQTDFVNQMQHFEYTEKQLQFQIEDAIREYNCKSPMFSKIGFFLGAIVAIIFI